MVLITACTGTKFTYTTDQRLSKIGKPVTICLNPDSVLHKRQVMKVYDITNRTYRPANGAMQIDDPKELVEVEYLFLFRKAWKGACDQ